MRKRRQLPSGIYFDHRLDLYVGAAQYMLARGTAVATTSKGPQALQE